MTQTQTGMTYTNFTNLDAGFWRPYEKGDRLVKGWTADFPDGWSLEALFAKHNRDDRPDGQLCPSMSVGDVVVITAANGEVGSWSVASFGFDPVTVDPADLITDRTWTEVR